MSEQVDGVSLEGWTWHDKIWVTIGSRLRRVFGGSEVEADA